MISKEHFNADTIEAKQQALVDRYNKLAEPVKKRKKVLEDSKDYQQFLHDVEDEESWIREKEPIASSLHTGAVLFCAVFGLNFMLFFVICCLL